MNLRHLCCLMSVCGALASADENKQAGGQEPAEQQEQGPRAPAPPWMKWGIEFRGRLEMPRAINFETGLDDVFYLNRIRAWAGIEPSLWLRFYVEAQDARAPGFSDPSGKDAVIHHTDFRQAYGEVGRSDGTWALRLGRQELAFGDERLVGADKYWDALGQSFDAARLSYKKPGVRVDLFGAFVLIPTCDTMVRSSTGNQLYGLYASFDKIPRGTVIEPYLFWKSNRRTGAGTGPLGDSDVFTYGARTAGNLPSRIDYNVEMALQGGHEADESIHAWAGHWEVGFRPLRGDFGPRLGAEYNFASGDRRPGDGRHTTFDDLYPAGYNKFGMADPFAWRNLRNISGTVDWGLTQRWRVGFGYRALWVASVHDGLYTKGDDYLIWNSKASSDHVGDQASVMATWEYSKNLQFYAGYARFFPGSYLMDSSYHGEFSTPFFMVNYRFE